MDRLRLWIVLGYIPTLLVLLAIVVMVVTFLLGWRILVIPPVPSPTPTSPFFQSL